MIWFTHNKLLIVIACILTILTGVICSNIPRLVKYFLVCISILVCFGLAGETIFVKNCIFTKFDPTTRTRNRYLLPIDLCLGGLLGGGGSGVYCTAKFLPNTKVKK